MLPIRSKITEAMRRPDCIMGVTPDNGGSWLSPIRADGPQPTTLPATSGQPWAIGSGMLSPQGGMVIDGAFQFPAGDASARCGTALDMRGYAGDFTALAAFSVAAGTQTKNWYLDLLGQGYLSLGFGGYTVRIQVYHTATGSQWVIAAGICTETAQTFRNAGIGQISAGIHVAGFVRDRSAGTLQAYFDGKPIGAALSPPDEPLLSAIDSTWNPDIGVCVGAGFRNSSLSPEVDYSVFAAAVFDRALSAEEIAYFS